MVVNGLSKSSFKLLLLAPNLLPVVGGLSGSLGVVDGLSQSLGYLGRWESLPGVDGLAGSLTVFHGR